MQYLYCIFILKISVHQLKTVSQNHVLKSLALFDYTEISLFPFFILPVNWQLLLALGGQLLLLRICNYRTDSAPSKQLQS